MPSRDRLISLEKGMDENFKMRKEKREEKERNNQLSGS